MPRIRNAFLFALVLTGLFVFSIDALDAHRSRPLPRPQNAPYKLPAAVCNPNVVNYDIVYVRAPRRGNNENTSQPDTTRPMNPEPNTQLRLLHPDCTDELLFPRAQDAGIVDAAIANGAATDPNIAFDGKHVVFAYYHDAADINPQRDHSRKGADIYRLDLQTRVATRLTHQEFTPNTGNAANFDCAQPYTNCPRIGVFNIGPAFVAANDAAHPDIVFTSTRNNYLPPKPFGNAGHTLQLFTMDWDGNNVEQIGHLNLSRALHPFQLLDGRLMFTSWENQGARDDRQFNLWTIRPDGREWNSLSGFGENAIGHHFATQMPNGDIVVVRYYNFNNNGFGDLARFPLDPNGADFRGIDEANTYMPFERKGQINLTNWTDTPYALADDFPAPCAVGNNIHNDTGANCAGGNATRIGKVTHPAVAPNGDLLLIYTKGPANHNGIYVGSGRSLPFYDNGIYIMRAQKASDGTALPNDLQKILNDPDYNEQWARPVVAYAQIFAGHAQPNVSAHFQNVNNEDLPDHTAFGLVGTSSLIWRDTKGRNGPAWAPDPDPFNSSHEFLSAWLHQGADAGIYSANDIYAVRLITLLPATDRRYPNGGANFSQVGGERVRILGEMPVRHEGVIDGNGNTDTSFLARIPADTPFTFQTLDRNGMVLNMAQTWHQLRPGEARYDCGGCHAHAQTPLDFNTTWAHSHPYTDLALQTPLLNVTQMNGSPATTTQNVTQTTIEYLRDIKPILDTKCAGCHNNDSSDGNLNLHDDANTIDGVPGTYYRLARDSGAQYGFGTPAGTESYFLHPTLTRYLRAFNARESLLIWKVFNARLDGRANNTRSGDNDFTASATHANLLTWDEKMKFARWVDLGAPIDLSNNGTWGWFEDDLRPTLWASPTIEQANAGAVNQVTVAAYDLESGLKNNSLRVTFDVPINGNAAGHNFAQGINPANGGTVNVPLGGSVDLAALETRMTVSIQDNAGHTTTLTRAFGGQDNGGSCDTAPAPPNALSPAQDALVTTRRVTLDWSDADCATRYEAQVRQGSKKGAQVFARTDLATSQARTPRLNVNTRYAWRTRACNDTVCSAWTKWWRFTVQ